MTFLQSVPTLPNREEALTELFKILTIKRSANSKGELRLILDYIVPVIGPLGARRDDYGNYILRIGDDPVMWSCHTDTVHYHKDDDIYQRLDLSDEGLLSVVNSSCLGADNGVGVWIMLQMIKAGKPGLYIFHREEEIGGRGSNYIAEHTPEVVKGIQYAIAFDRRGTGSVITFQGARTCSDAFADSLISALGIGHAKDDGGVFTDTANYRTLIPECTNISAGFYNEHTYRESLDVHYAYELLEAVVALDIHQLEVSRNPDDPVDWGNGWWMGGGYKSYRESRACEFDDPAYLKSRIMEDPELVYYVLREWGVAEELVRDMDRYT
jgi:hypothetical protein